MRSIVIKRSLGSFSDNLKSKIQNLKSAALVAIGICLMTSVLLTTGSSADAQQQKKVARVGYLGNTASVEANSMKPFRERLRQLGYTEGQNITIEHRSWEGRLSVSQSLPPS